ncbi:ABC transporter permease subunit [Micromonospora sp. NPDC005174]|uniref:ABC transporter permease subunit n=1 Tax=Micromonospora sp. NPDC005174 TaxID=3157018 RepID=UPI0033A97EC4
MSDFGRLVRAEWTKFRTVRGWVLGTVAAALVTVLLGLFVASNSHSVCSKGTVDVECPTSPVGPDGQPVRDKFYFVHQPLAGDGAITVRVTSMTGLITYPPPDHDEIVPGLVEWAKAGVIVKDGTAEGSRYVALMVTAKHGVRMQHDFVHDTAGKPGAVSADAPRWLRLTRVGDTLTGEESADGASWTSVGTAQLAGTVEIGLFVTSPSDLTVHGGVGGGGFQARLAKATATFDSVGLTGTAPGGDWLRDDIGVEPNPDGTLHHPGSVEEAGGVMTVSGNGDIAPLTGESGPAIQLALIGLVIGLIVVIVVAALFITTELRRGVIGVTLLASPRRGRVLAAKAVVLGAVTFVAGTAAAALVIPLAWAALRSNGFRQPGVPLPTIARVALEAGLLVAGAALLALGLGALLRRGLAAVGIAVAVVVLPYLAAVVGGLPTAASEWLLRLTPAAAFAIQQVTPEYAHVLASYTPGSGYYPLPAWGGLAVMAGYAALALGLASARLRRSDA